MSYNVEQLKSLISRRGGVAQANMWKVHLPALPGVQSSRDLNVLCKDVQLPGRQILTQERTIGMRPKKVAYAYGEEDVSMTFLLLNDYGVKDYFEAWQNMTINFETQGIKYKNDYCRDIIITQLARRKKDGIDINFNIDLSANSLAEMFDLSISTDIEIYKCRLKRAFPTTMNALQLNNEQNGLLELNIQMSYDNWESI
tara:strand:+ start:1351 stop:1947 length:597 start_codon:yes stop_codon:yes gene_type:complete